MVRRVSEGWKQLKSDVYLPIFGLRMSRSHFEKLAELVEQKGKTRIKQTLTSGVRCLFRMIESKPSVSVLERITF